MSNPEKGADRAAQTRREKELEGIKQVQKRVEQAHFIEEVAKSVREAQEAGKYSELEAEEKIAQAQWFADMAAGTMGKLYAHDNLVNAIFGSILTLCRQGNISPDRMIPAALLALGLTVFELITDMDDDDPRHKEAMRFWVGFADTMFSQVWSAIGDRAKEDAEQALRAQAARAGKGGAMHHVMAKAWTWCTDTYPDADAAAKRIDRLAPLFQEMLLDDTGDTFNRAQKAVDKAVGEN